MIFLRICSSENIVPNKVQNENHREDKVVLEIGVVEEVMALNGENKGDENIISKDQHVAEFLTDDVPSC